jgi:hypothetical protein
MYIPLARDIAYIIFSTVLNGTTTEMRVYAEAREPGAERPSLCCLHGFPTSGIQRSYATILPWQSLYLGCTKVVHTHHDLVCSFPQLVIQEPNIAIHVAYTVGSIPFISGPRVYSAANNFISSFARREIYNIDNNTL